MIYKDAIIDKIEKISKKNSLFKIFLFLFSILSFFIYDLRKIRKLKKRKTFRKNISKNNVIIADNYHAIGDFVIFLKTLKNLDFSNFYVVVSDIFREIIESEDFKNINFIYFKNNIGSHYNIIKSLKSVSDILESLKNELKNAFKLLNVNNVFIFSDHINIEHLTILNSFNYNQCLFLNKYSYKFNGNNTSELWKRTLKWPIYSGYLCLFHTIKNLNIKIFNPSSILNHQSNSFIEMINFVLKTKYDYVCYENQKKDKSNIKTINVLINMTSSNTKKDLHFVYFLNLITKFIDDFNTKKLVFHVVGNNWVSQKYYNSLCIFFSNYKNVSFIKKISLKKIINYFQTINFCDYVLTNDTSSLHIAVYYNKNVFAFLNENDEPQNFFNYWYGYNINNVNYFVLNNEMFCSSFNPLFFFDYKESIDKIKFKTT